jgi:transcriptional regulator with XRE-family HTH domain
MNLGPMIRNRRRRSGLSCYLVAARLDVHRNTIGNWERNLTQPTVQELLDLYRVLGSSREDVLVDLRQAFEEAQAVEVPDWGR